VLPGPILDQRHNFHIIQFHEAEMSIAYVEVSLSPTNPNHSFTNHESLPQASSTTQP
jgi:hypothetical protein